MDFWQSVICTQKGKIKEGETMEEWNDKQNDSQLTAKKQTWTIEKDGKN